MECLECANFSFFVASRALISERVASFYWLLCFRGHDYHYPVSRNITKAAIILFHYLSGEKALGD